MSNSAKTSELSDYHAVVLVYADKLQKVENGGFICVNFIEAPYGLAEIS